MYPLGNRRLSIILGNRWFFGQECITFGDWRLSIILGTREYVGNKWTFWDAHISFGEHKIIMVIILGKRWFFGTQTQGSTRLFWGTGDDSREDMIILISCIKNHFIGCFTTLQSFHRYLNKERVRRKIWHPLLCRLSLRQTWGPPMWSPFRKLLSA